MTNNNQIIKDAVGFQKTLFDDAYNLVTRYQDNTENFTNSLVEKYGNVPDEWKKNLKE